MAISKQEILELMLETIAECEAAIDARPLSRKDREITLVSSGYRIVQVETDEEALVWTR